MAELLKRMFSHDGFMPHGHCYLWNPALVWLHVISDGLIAFAYTSIPFTLIYFSRRRRDLPFNWMFLSFGAFIVACGATHVMEIWTLWSPSYWLSGSIKAVTAVASLSTAAALVVLTPKALAIPSATDLEKAHAELRQLHEVDVHYRSLLDTAPDAIVVVGENGRIEFVNLRTEVLFGYTRDELVGQELELLIPERFRSGHRTLISQFLMAPSPRAMGSGLELFALRKDGTELPIEVSLSPLRTERGVTVSAAIRDISVRKELQAAAQLGAQRLKSAVESIQDAFALFDDEDRLVLCNSAYRRLIAEAYSGPVNGAPYEQLLSAWTSGVSFPDQAQRDAFLASRLAPSARQQTPTFDLQTQTGRNLRVTDRRTPEGGTVQTIWDLTDDVRAAEELREARLSAEAANRAKSEFLSSMSHELRTPLNAILGFAQLAQRDRKEPLSERHGERILQILRGGEHLLRLIDDILDLSRIEAGGVSISIEPVDVLEVLEEVMGTLEPAAAARSVHLQRAAALKAAPAVAADRTRFKQILMNLGSNAIKYNRPEGKVVFTVSATLERVRVAVRDTGIGIPLDHQDKLFQPFQRAGQETGPIEGTGIGLVITRRLAELMGGAVDFRSVPGDGSEFWVEIPIHQARGRSSTPPPAWEPRRPRTLGAGGAVVIYVEDNPANVRFMMDLLGAFDDVVLLSAPTAEIGIQLARERSPTAIIMDINLPGLSGLDALRSLRAQPETARIPVIALTAAASDHDKRTGIRAGFYQYLTKPVKVDELVAALERVLA